MARIAATRVSGASPGEPRSRRRFSRGVRTMGSMAPTRRSAAEQRLANGGRPRGWCRRRRRADHERPGAGLHCAVRRRPRTQFRADAAARADERTYTDDFNTVKALGRKTGSARTAEQTAARAVLGRQCQRPLEPGRQPDRARQSFLDVRMQPASRRPEHRDGRDRDHHLERQAILRFGSNRSDLAAGRPRFRSRTPTAIRTPLPDPSLAAAHRHACHPEYPAGHPSQNGAAATVLLRHFDDRQAFTLTTIGQPSRTYDSIAQARADGNNARVWGGMHFRAPSRPAMPRARRSRPTSIALPCSGSGDRQARKTSHAGTSRSNAHQPCSTSKCSVARRIPRNACHGLYWFSRPVRRHQVPAHAEACRQDSGAGTVPHSMSCWFGRHDAVERGVTIGRVACGRWASVGSPSDSP